MAEIMGSEVVARALKKQGTDILFFLMGGPMIECEGFCGKEGIRLLDVRHEQAAAMMATAYARLTQRPAVCMAASGPGVINLTTGVANAYIDCAPMVVVGGASPLHGFGRGVFQDIDQLAIFRPMTKHAERVNRIERIPEKVAMAFRRAMAGKPGPVYLDLPGDVLFAKIEESKLDFSMCTPFEPERPMADPKAIEKLVAALGKAKQPVILTGSGVIYSRAGKELTALIEKTGIPFYTTPQGRGSVPDDHEHSYMSMRSAAFAEADLFLVVGTRLNYVMGHLEPPRFNADAKVARIEIDADELASSPRRIDVPVLGDAKVVLQQLLDAIGGKITKKSYEPWRKRLESGADAKRKAPGGNALPDGDPIHPLHLCDEVKKFMKRDAILCVDGQEILTYGRQWIPTFEPGHRLNSGPFGTMGVGLPFGIGAKLARPDKQVIVLHGDGSFGLNAMELDTAVRHKIPLLCVISLNGGWTGDPKREKAGRELGYTRFDKMAEALGCYAEYVDTIEGIAPALKRAQAEVDKGRVAVVNVKTFWAARAQQTKFTAYMT
jgi:thiamine pyrophosphate-dependent acetolactate synthase large subunit-like protein